MRAGTMAAAAVAAVTAMGCKDTDTCLGGACPAVCVEVEVTCDASSASMFLVGERPDGSGLANAQAGANDLVLDNGVITAVIAALDAPADLSTTGGFLIDFGPSAGVDDLTILYQLAGILPEDTLS